jgi:hypothetical protein
MIPPNWADGKRLEVVIEIAAKWSRGQLVRPALVSSRVIAATAVRGIELRRAEWPNAAGLLSTCLAGSEDPV